MDKNITSKELTMIIKPHHEMEVLAVTTQVLSEYDATLARVDLRGTERLAYPIGDNEMGGYIYMEYFVDTERKVDCAKVLNSALDNCAEVLRHLDIQIVDDKAHEMNVYLYEMKYGTVKGQ